MSFCSSLECVCVCGVCTQEHHCIYETFWTVLCSLRFSRLLENFPSPIPHVGVLQPSGSLWVHGIRGVVVSQLNFMSLPRAFHPSTTSTFVAEQWVHLEVAQLLAVANVGLRTNPVCFPGFWKFGDVLKFCKCCLSELKDCLRSPEGKRLYGFLSQQECLPK